MKIIFLDVDGVLNSDLYFSSTEYRSATEGMTPTQVLKEAIHLHINPESIGKLNVLVEKTGAIVVLSSDWRKSFSLDEINTILKSRGATFKVMDYTPTITGGWGASIPRGVEIQVHLDSLTEPVENFVIFDDNDDMLRLREKLVLTNSRIGLTDKNIQKALQILNKGL